jgi:sarcosine oxidase subunit beta
VNAPHQNYDVAVIGAGVVGMSTAWQLARTGLRCIVLDKVGIGAGATALQPGGVRTQWGRRATAEFALESQAFYKDFVGRTGASQDPQLVECGYAFVASTDEALARLAEVAEAQRQMGIKTTMMSAEQLGEVIPGLDVESIRGGSFNAEDGYLNLPGAPVSGFAEAATRSGAEMLIDRVELIRSANEKWTLTLASGAHLTVPTVVLAAGSATTDLAQSAGLTVPISAEPRYLFYSDPIRERLIEPLVIFQDEHLAVKHLADGSVLASDLSIGPDEAVDETRWRRQVTEKTRRLAPILTYVNFPVMVTGYYDVTPDTEFALGSFPEAPGLVFAAGMNGRGMMLAPSVGRVIAEFVATGDIAAIPADMQVDRFSSGRAHQREAMVI